MAQQPALKDLTETDDAANNGAEARHDAQALGKLQEHLRKYSSHHASGERDILQERYQVNLAAPLPEFDSKTSRAYAASDLADSTRQLFAQVCLPGTLQRHRAINQLKGVAHPSIAALLAAGPVMLSRPEEERFVIFYERPAGKKLSELLTHHTGELSVSFICERIIAPLAAALNQFSDLDISHGILNADNVYFKDIAQLGPCVSEPCGYSQIFYFEPLERIQTQPSGKGEGSTAQDFYALAVLVLYILHGKSHFANFTPNGLAASIFKEGVYNALTRQKDVPEMFYDFFRGTLSQFAKDRWGYRHIKPWLDGKRYNVLSPPPPLEAIRPFDFGDMQANTRRELAHLLATHWEQIPAAISNNQLYHWVAVSLRNKELAEHMSRLSRNVAELGVKNEVQLNEQLMRIILLLDPAGPIRIKNLSFNVDGLDALYAELYNNKSHAELQIVAKFIEFNLANYWLELQRTSADFVPPPLIAAICLKLERMRTYIRNSGFGFGLERALYDLNPEMPCMSPLFNGMYAHTLPILLKKLDQLAPALSKQDEPLDRHIAAFIASKLNMQHEIRLHDLSAIPELAGHRAMIALYLLSTAQQRSGNIELPGLTHWLCIRIYPLLDAIHSRTLRHEFKARLAAQAPTGYVPGIANIVINSDYAVADKTGFSQAWNLYQNNAVKIESYRQGEFLEQQSLRLGLRVAKALAYIGLLGSLVFVIQNWG